MKQEPDPIDEMDPDFLDRWTFPPDPDSGIRAPKPALEAALDGYTPPCFGYETPGCGPIDHAKHSARGKRRSDLLDRLVMEELHSSRLNLFDAIRDEDWERLVADAKLLRAITVARCVERDLG